jgi:hypothetical protein
MFVINRIESEELERAKMDDIYNELVEKAIQEMDNNLDYRDISTKNKKKLKTSKPYWNNNLTIAWKNMVTKEKAYLKNKGSRREQGRLKQLFKSARYDFDKLLRKAKKDYERLQIENLDVIDTENPNEFWRYIKNLGPKKNNDIPLKVRVDNELKEDECIVKETWFNEYKLLFNNFDGTNFDDDFFNENSF